MDSSSLNDLLEMLMSDIPNVRSRAFVALAQLSGSADGASIIMQCNSILSVVVGSMAATSVEDSTPLLPTALTTLTNIAASHVGATAVMSHHKVLLPPLIKLITTPSSIHADRACGLLVNLTRDPNSCRRCLAVITQDMPSMVVAAANTAHNTASCSLDLLMAVLENTSQLEEGRKIILDRKKIMIQRLFSFTQYTASKARRRAAVATLHNCCFQKDAHGWLLSPDVDMASNLCLPLAGPDVFTEEESGHLSDLLVFQPDNKQREPCEDVRLLLLQALTQLCATRAGREALRLQHVYLVLRELHKWERSGRCLALLEDLVNILIRTEEEIGAEDISKLEVSEDLHKKFSEFDKQYEEESAPASADSKN